MLVRMVVLGNVGALTLIRVHWPEIDRKPDETTALREELPWSIYFGEGKCILSDVDRVIGRNRWYFHSFWSL